MKGDLRQERKKVDASEAELWQFNHARAADMKKLQERQQGYRHMKGKKPRAREESLRSKSEAELSRHH